MSSTGTKWEVTYDDRNRIIIFKSSGIGDGVSAAEGSEDVLAMYREHPSPLLVDATDAVGVTRTGVREYANALNEITHRVAVISTSGMIRTAVKVMFQLAGRSKQLKIFRTKEKALAWLKKKE